MGEVNSDDLRKSGYVAHFMLVYSTRAEWGECLAVPGQLELYSAGLAMSSTNDGLGVIPGDLLSFNCLLLPLTFFCILLSQRYGEVISSD